MFGHCLTCSKAIPNVLGVSVTVENILLSFAEQIQERRQAKRYEQTGETSELVRSAIAGVPKGVGARKYGGISSVRRFCSMIPVDSIRGNCTTFQKRRSRAQVHDQMATSIAAGCSMHAARK
jgi:hypothetical protein